ncbi:excalibur calcium-binding domain-containing protein [Psychrobacter sp.]|uniref:excalibur calcium-binding domain-containing protein n=1 Tax=Psychrobacter sp. TaxID=56811 RepID=UPI003C787669
MTSIFYDLGLVFQSVLRVMVNDMLDKLAKIILRIFAWMFGTLFMLGAIIALFSGNFLFAFFLAMGAMLILPPFKERIVQRLPKTNGVMLTTIGCIIVFFSFVIFPSPSSTGSTVVESSNKQIIEQVDNDSETAWDKPIIPVEELDTETSESTVVLDDKAEDVFDSEPEVNDVKEQKVIAEPEPIRIAEISNGNDCSGMYKTCGEMANCAEAQKALACGNGRLDRDNDGIPCESICQ